MRAVACEVEATKLNAIVFFAFAMMVGCDQAQRDNTVLTHSETETWSILRLPMKVRTN
jgi:hypothetical protein